MNKNFFKEFCKFLSGLVAGDFLVGLWLFSKNMLPISFLGVTIGQTGAIFWMLFDIIIFFVLIYYAWVPKGNSQK